MDNSEADKYSYRKLCEQIHKAFYGYGVFNNDDHHQLHLVKTGIKSAASAEKSKPASSKKFKGMRVK